MCIRDSFHPEGVDVGFVLSADVRFECASVYDGGTMSAAHGGCDRCTCGTPDCYWCVYRGHQLGDFVRAHLGADRMQYNEVVILAAEYEALLPHAIAAVLCRGWDCGDARGVRARFLEAYGLKAAEVPLVRYSSSSGFVEVS